MNYLSTEERRRLEYTRSRAITGFYRLKDLLGETLWASVESKPGYGKRARASIEAGQIHGFELYGITAQNHRVYLVTNPVVA